MQTTTAKGTTTTKTTATTTKPSLSESQRNGAIERAAEAKASADRILANMPKDHPHAKLIATAANSAMAMSLDSVVAGSVADAQYASRKAIEAAAAAAWLFGQR